MLLRKPGMTEASVPLGSAVISIGEPGARALPPDESVQIEEKHLAPRLFIDQVVLNHAKASTQAVLDRALQEVQIIGDLELLKVPAGVPVEDKALVATYDGTLHRLKQELDEVSAQLLTTLQAEQKKVQEKDRAVSEAMRPVLRKQINLIHLKRELAWKLQRQIKKFLVSELKKEELREERQERIANLNAQFKGFAHIPDNYSGKTESILVKSLLKTFSELSLRDIALSVTGLLRQADNAGSRLTDSAKMLNTVLRELACDVDYQKLLGDASKPFTLTVDVLGRPQFVWGEKPATLLEDAVSETAIKAYVEQQQAAGGPYAEVQGIKEQIERLEKLRIAYQQKHQEYTYNIQVEGLLDEFSQLNLKHEAGETPAVNSLIDRIVVLGRNMQMKAEARSLSNQERDKVLSDLRMHLNAARTSCKLLEALKLANVVYQGVVPAEVLGPLLEAVRVQDALVEAIVRPATTDPRTTAPAQASHLGEEQKMDRREEKHEIVDDHSAQSVTTAEALLEQLNQAVLVLQSPAERIHRQLCGVLMTAILDHNYWHEQLYGSSLGLRKKEDVPTGILEMQNLIHSMWSRSQDPKWADNPVVAKDFLTQLKAIARRRIAYKNTIFCGFFKYSPIRNTHLSQFYQFLDKLNLDAPERSRGNLQDAERLHAVTTTTSAANKKRGAQAEFPKPIILRL